MTTTSSDAFGETHSFSEIHTQRFHVAVLGADIPSKGIGWQGKEMRRADEEQG